MTDIEFEQIKSKIEDMLKYASEPMHAYDHAIRVAENTQKIAHLLKVDREVDLNLLKAAGLMHDIPKALTKANFVNHVVYYFFESSLIKKEMPRILTDLKIKRGEFEIIYEAVLRHTLSYPFRRLNKNGDLYTKIVQDADTLDFFNPQRMVTFNKFKNKYLFYRLINLLDWLNTNVGFKNLAWFLNYPELVNNINQIYKNQKNQ